LHIYSYICTHVFCSVLQCHGRRVALVVLQCVAVCYTVLQSSCDSSCVVV